MTTNRKSTAKSRRRPKRNYKREVSQQGNASPGGKKAKTRQRGRTNAARKHLGLSKGDVREAVHGKKHGRGSVHAGNAKRNAKSQPKRGKKHR